MATTFVLVRHGETDWNRERRFQGHADPPLNETGRAQARELAHALAGDSFAIAYSSPLQRSYETAEIVAGQLGLDVLASSGLMEVDVGSWSGLTTTEAEARFPDGFRRWQANGSGWTDGETYDELGRRVVAELFELAAKHPEERVLAVTHGGPMRSVLAAAAGLPYESSRSEIAFIENCAIVQVAVRDGSIEAVD